MFPCDTTKCDTNYEEGCFFKRPEYLDYYIMPVTCKYCGKKYLEWVLTKNGYKLYDMKKNKQHRCYFGFKTE